MSVLCTGIAQFALCLPGKDAGFPSRRPQRYPNDDGEAKNDDSLTPQHLVKVEFKQPGKFPLWHSSDFEQDKGEGDQY
jgi:hypothetical protein